MRHYFDEGEQRYNLDRIYPYRRKVIEDRPDMMAHEIESNPGISGETELIARTAYRLGHAEALADSAMREARLERSEHKEIAEKLSEVRDSHRYYKDQNERLEQRNDELLNKVAKLEKKLKPKKATKKKAKK